MTLLDQIPAPQLPDGEWQAVAFDSLRIHQWDSETALYDIRSGDTHLIGSFALDILKALATPKSAAALMDILSASGTMPDEVSEADIHTLLRDLQQQKLITRVT